MDTEIVITNEDGASEVDQKYERLYGCFPSIDNQVYHANKLHLSRTSLMDFAQSPYTYWANHINPNRPIKVTTPAMQFGSAFHTFMLEKHLFDEQYAVKPDPVLLKDVGRELYNAHKKICEEFEKSKKIVLTRDAWLTIEAMANKILSNPHAIQLIEGARIENSFFWQEEHSGLLLKARPDVLQPNMIVDLKTCADASPRAFQAAMVSGGYHIQGAMIRDAVERIESRRIDTVINVCIETKYPHNIGIYFIDEFALDEGEKKYKRLCLELLNSLETDTFSDYGIQTISLPKWAL